MSTGSNLLFVATRGSAVAVGFGEQLGGLQKGAHADMILVDLNTPKLQPFYEVPQTLVYNVDGPDITHVFVAGQQVVSHGRCELVDEAIVVEEVRKRIPRFLDLVARIAPNHRALRQKN